MMGAVGLKGPSMAAVFARQRLTTVPRPTRTISTFRPQSTLIPSRGSQSVLSSVRSVPWRTAAIAAGPAAVRFNSSMPDTTPPTTDLHGSASWSKASDFSDLDITMIPEKIGYLKELGLDYGWGPSSIMQFVIEHIHIWTGVPWWAAIVGAGLLVRVLLLKPMIDASDVNAKMHNTKHIMQPLRQKMMRAASEGNQLETQQLRAQLEQLSQEHGIKMYKSFLPMLQIPFGYGMFRVVRGMATLPVPSMVDESLFWIKDMTVLDPTYILPALTSLVMYYAIKTGAANSGGEFFNGPLGKALMIGLPLMTVLFMSFQPAALQLYFATTGVWAFGQAYLLNNRSFREKLGLTLHQRQLESTGGMDPKEREGFREFQQRLAAEKRYYADLKAGKVKSGQSNDKVSALDRWINQGKTAFGDMAADAGDKLREMQGQNTKNADGSKMAPPRLSDHERKQAEQYEMEREGADHYLREERNQARMKYHEEQRRKAKDSWQKQKDDVVKRQRRRK